MGWNRDNASIPDMPPVIWGHGCGGGLHAQ